MSTHQARMVIPDHWADIGRCPICNMPTLHVACQTGQPDQMACSSCGCGFEIEVDGPAIRMTWISPEYKQRLQSLPRGSGCLWRTFAVKLPNQSNKKVRRSRTVRLSSQFKQLTCKRSRQSLLSRKLHFTTIHKVRKKSPAGRSSWRSWVTNLPGSDPR